MANDYLFRNPFEPIKSKKRNVTPAQKIWCWENKPHKCNICGKRITKFSDAEFDHSRAYAKGGASNLGNVRLTHRNCNRLKGKKTLSETKRQLGIKTKPKKRKTTKRRTRKSQNPFDIGFKPPKLPF